ncbi:7tm Odorant receptor [Popillia japonica]|uniref:7tm Odorant receptor n=1 Tax=Popillia japonica TaxID=7064 RepID=A0AAW1NIY1_POPJA
MELIGEDDILTMSISMFKILGEGHRHDKDKFINIFRCVNICMFIWNLIIILGSIPYATGFVYINIMEGALSCSHALLKYACFIYYKSDIEKLLHDFQEFWKITQIPAIYGTAKIVHKYLFFGEKAYLTAGLTVMFIYNLRPLMDKQNRFMFECWPLLNQSIIMEAIVLFSQFYFFLVYISIVFAFDIFYIAYSIHLIMQLKLLKYTFEHIRRQDGSGRIYECIRQHKLLLGVFNRMRNVYFWMLLFYYAVTLITGCSQLYIILLAQPGLFEMIASTIYLAALLVEFGVYTISVEEIVYQLTDISRSIYMSTWYERNLSDKRDLLMIMMKTQQQKYLSAAGMIDMNVDTFGSSSLNSSMETIGEDDILTMSISMFKIVGEGNRHDKDKFINIFRCVNIAMFIWNLIIIFGSIPYATGFVYIKIMEGALSCSHALLKYVCFIYYKSDIEKLLDDLRAFWKITNTPAIYKIAKIVYKYLFFGQKVYLVAGLTVMFIYNLRPVLEKQNRFMFECWPLLNNSNIMEAFVLFSQYYFFLIYVPVVYAFDNFYIAYSIHVILQLRLLKYSFEQIKHEDESGLIHQCVRQHKLLLGRMRDVYFWMLLFHYAVTLITGCSHLYIILLAQPGLFEMIASTIYLAALIVEFGVYTISVEEIVYQLTDISRSIYMSTWYERNLSDKRDLLMIMMKTQRQKYLSAAGMIDMNVDTFGSALLKYVCFIYYKSDIEKMLDDLQEFWKITEVPEIDKVTKIVYKYLFLGQKMYARRVHCSVHIRFTPVTGKADAFYV